MFQKKIHKNCVTFNAFKIFQTWKDVNKGTEEKQYNSMPHFQHVATKVITRLKVFFYLILYAFYLINCGGHYHPHCPGATMTVSSPFVVTGQASITVKYRYINCLQIFITHLLVNYNKHTSYLVRARGGLTLL